LKVGTEVARFFIETEEGEIVDEDRFDKMRKYARKIWDLFETEGSVPPSWGQAARQLKQRYHKLMRDNFPELKLCNDNWKADQIATSNYPSWYQYWVVRKSHNLDSENLLKRRVKKKLKSKSVSSILLF
jgi:hypothetical protein